MTVKYSKLLWYRFLSTQYFKVRSFPCLSRRSSSFTLPNYTFASKSSSGRSVEKKREPEVKGEELLKRATNFWGFSHDVTKI